jgi:hypothetical protein
LTGVARRLVGGALLALSLVPLWLLLARHPSPLAREAFRITREQFGVTMLGAVALLALVVVASRLARSAAPEPRVPAPGGWPLVRALEQVPLGRYAAGLGALSFGLSAAIAWLVFDRQPVLVDAHAQLVQARYFAAGLFGGPAGEPYEFWVGTNTFVPDGRWVSQYPPGHAMVLALGFLADAVWVSGPALMAVTAGFTALAAERLLPNDRTAARVGSVLVALSPFLLILAATQMSHVTAAALTVVALYSALRACDGSAAWSVAAGAAGGLLFATRPLTAVVVWPIVTLGVWLAVPMPARSIRALAKRAAGAALGAGPFMGAAAWYADRVFGSPLAQGYTAYLGSAHGLGLHLDPYGYPYDLSAALAFTSSDLVSLGHELLRAPLPLTALIGGYLALGSALKRGEAVLVAWGVSLAGALALYWHHDLAFGPRLLADAAPAWGVLTALAGLGLLRLVRHRTASRWLSPRALGAGMALAVAVGLAVRTPIELRELRGRFGNRLAPPVRPVPALVFVHDSWKERIAARMIAQGVRGDSVAQLVERTPLCRLHLAVEARATGAMEAYPGPSEPDVESVVCAREQRADRFGGLPLLPLLWRGDLPGLTGSGVLFARDLGPDRNAVLRARHAGREALVLFLRPPGRQPALAPYDVGMDILWGSSEGEPVP